MCGEKLKWNERTKLKNEENKKDCGSEEREQFECSLGEHKLYWQYIECKIISTSVLEDAVETKRRKTDIKWGG